MIVVPLVLVAAACLSAGGVAASSPGSVISADAVSSPSSEQGWGRGSRAGCPPRTKPADGLCLGRDANAQAAAALVRSTFESEKLGAVIVGVWRGGKPVVVGALGDSMTGVPATVDMHHIVGNASTAMLTTVLLQLVQEGTLSLDDTFSKWFPQAPSADLITLDMLAHNTSGYQHYPSSPAFVEAFYADPFREWTATELVQYAFELPGPLAFPPGTSWTFADTNPLLLQIVMEKVTGRPMGELIEQRVLDPLHMRDTTLATTAATLEPVLHGYTGERGVWEDATFWSPTWIQYAGGISSNQDDLRRFIEAAGSGRLLSAQSHRAQLAPTTVGLGPMTEDFYYGMGIGVSNGWVFVNPRLQGYSAGVATLPDKNLTIVVYSTLTQAADQNSNHGSNLFVALATLLSPDQPPKIPSR